MDWLARAAADRPDAAAVVAGDRTITYEELDRAAHAVAGLVLASGVEGTGVGFWGLRDPVTVAAIWGVCRAGVAAVPLDPRLPPAEAMRLTRAAGVRGLLPVPEGGIDALLARSPRRRGDDWGPPHDGARMVLFTSGSEGRHRGVRLTGRNVAASVAASRARLGNGPDDRWLAVLPLHHAGGLSILWRQAEQAAPVVLEERFEPARVARLLGTVGFASLVPTMLRRVLDAGGGGTSRVLLGGGPAGRDLVARGLGTGLSVLPTYGLTETASQVATVAPGDEEEDLGTVGRPLEGVEVRISDRGRIEVRGEMVSPGYLDAPLPGGDRWFTTGDLGAVDGSGRLTVLGRADAVIVTGGENVHPGAVEQVLGSHPAVEGARVFGVPDDAWGHRVVAEVVLGAGADVGELAEWSAARLGPHEVPREWRVVDAVPAKLTD